MSADVPPPGETPQSGSAPEQSWWPGEDPDRPRHPRRRPPQAGTLLPQQEQAYAPETTAVKQRGNDELRTEPGGLERDHNRPDAYRYDPLRLAAGYDNPAEPPAAPETDPEPESEPDVMVLPEPDARNRPTVALEQGPVPGQGRVRLPEPLPRPTGDPATDARLEKLENSPFWSDNPEQAGTRRLPEVTSHAGGSRRRVRKGAIRKPAPALFALITLALVATFFAWVSAEPFWLAVGHGDRGYATTTACRGTGVVQRCAGRFEAADGSFAVTRVTLLGVAADKRTGGAVTAARMVSAGSRTAYVGDAGLLVQLRWVLGFLLVLICGYGIAGLTGARRLDDPRARRLVLLASVFAPIVLLVGFLAASY